LDPLSAAEISVAVATVREAGVTPEVNHTMTFLIKTYILIFVLYMQIVKIEPLCSEAVVPNDFFFPQLSICYSSETVCALLK